MSNMSCVDRVGGTEVPGVLDFQLALGRKMTQTSLCYRDDGSAKQRENKHLQ